MTISWDEKWFLPGGSFLPPYLPCSSLPVTGCSDSSPPHTTTDCHYAVPTHLSLHGLNFDLLCSETPPSPPGTQELVKPEKLPDRSGINVGVCTQNFKKHYSIHVGHYDCQDPKVLSDFAINCTLNGGTGTELDVVIERKVHGDDPNGGVMASLSGSVSFKEGIDFKEKFGKFVELGVGGLKREIDELYRRAFASRGGSRCMLRNGN